MKKLKEKVHSVAKHALKKTKASHEAAPLKETLKNYPRQIQKNKRDKVKKAAEKYENGEKPKGELKHALSRLSKARKKHPTAKSWDDLHKGDSIRKRGASAAHRAGVAKGNGAGILRGFHTYK